MEDVLEEYCIKAKIEINDENFSKILEKYISGDYLRMEGDTLNYLSSISKDKIVSKYISFYKIRSIDDCYNLVSDLKKKGLSDVEIKTNLKSSIKNDQILGNFIKTVAADYYDYLDKDISEIKTDEDAFNVFIEFFNQKYYEKLKDKKYLINRNQKLKALDSFIDKSEDINTTINGLLSLVYSGIINSNKINDKTLGMTKEEFIMILLKNSIYFKNIVEINGIDNLSKYNEVLGEELTDDEKKEIILLNEEVIDRFLSEDISTENIKKIFGNLNYFDLKNLIQIFCITRRSNALRNVMNWNEKDRLTTNDAELIKLDQLLNKQSTLDCLMSKYFKTPKMTF